MADVMQKQLPRPPAGPPPGFSRGVGGGAFSFTLGRARARGRACTPSLLAHVRYFIFLVMDRMEHQLHVIAVVVCHAVGRVEGIGRGVIHFVSIQ